MEVEDFVRGSKWDVLQELSNAPCSASMLSQKLKKSIANIVQILRILEAGGYVKQSATKKGKAGKPQILYALDQELVLLTLLAPGSTKKLRLVPSADEDFLLRVLALKQPSISGFLLKFFFCHEEFFSKVEGVAFLRSSSSEIELLSITEKVEDVRKDFSNISIKQGEKERKIVSWTHSLKEINEGIDRKEEYFLNLVKSYTVLFERSQGVFGQIKGV